MSSGLLIVISGPSGVGKGTIISDLCRESPQIEVSVSTTTRSPRPQEEEGESYFFVSEPAFEEKISSGFFLEWANVYGHYYGTSREAVKEATEKGKDILLELDVQGGMQVKANMPEAVLIFIAPPSLTELRRRITARGTEISEHIEKRMHIALQELKYYEEYDYIIINNRIEETVNIVKTIISAEKYRVFRNKDLSWE